jgi:hypothetical protein
MKANIFLLDGKEVGSESYGKLTGPYRISFIDKIDATKKIWR